MLNRVIVAHPGRQHSHQLAAALSLNGMLERYFCGIPTSKSSSPWYLMKAISRVGNWDQEIEATKVSCIPIAPCLRNLVSRVVGVGLRSSLGHRFDGWFDKIVSKKLPYMSYSAVVAYENSAKSIFIAAKRANKTTILDAASVHHWLQDRLSPPRESKREHIRITNNKDAEIQLADYIFTTSEMARESYLEAGANPDRTLVFRWE